MPLYFVGVMKGNLDIITMEYIFPPHRISTNVLQRKKRNHKIPRLLGVIRHFHEITVRQTKIIRHYSNRAVIILSRLQIIETKRRDISSDKNYYL